MKLTSLRTKVTRRIDQARKAIGGALQGAPQNGNSDSASISLVPRDLPPPVIKQLPPPTPPSGSPLPPPKVETAYTPPEGTNGPLMMETPPFPGTNQTAVREQAPTPLEKMLRELHGTGPQLSKSRSGLPLDGESKEQYLDRLDDRWRVDSFNSDFKEAGWTVHSPKDTIWVENYEGREVAFYTRDDQGKQVAHRGVIAERPKGEPLMSSRFQLEGGDRVFNANHFESFAVKPEKPEQPNVSGRDFKARYQEAGWDVRGKGGGSGSKYDPKFGPYRLGGRDVAFVTYANDGKMYEYSGVLNPVPNPSGNSTLFTLEGQEGQFNSNLVSDFAVRRKDPQFPKAPT